MALESALYLGGVCNGAGTPVNVSGTTYCQCDPWFNGGSDFFDTRFAGPSPNLSLSCTNPRIGEIVIWSLVLVAGIIRIIGTIRMVREKFALFLERHPSVTKSWTWGDMYRNFALRVLLMDLLVLSPICLATGGLKVAGHTMGTDVAVTLLYIFTVIFFQLGNSMLAAEEFKAVTHFMPKAERKFLYSFRTRLEIMSWAAYLLGAFAPTIAALALDKTLGPLVNGEYITIIVRNLFVVSWSALAFGAQKVVFDRFTAMIGSVQNSESASAVKTMQDAKKSLVRLYLVISLLYLVFVAPPLWGYQTFCYGTIVFFGTFRSPAKAFKSMKASGGWKSTSPDSKIGDLASGSMKDMTVAPASMAPSVDRSEVA